MRNLLFLGCGVLLMGAAWQVNLPSPLASHIDNLSKAETLTVELSGRYLGETPTMMKLSLGKPNRFRLTTPTGFVVSDGTTVTTYVAKDKTYTEEPANADSVAAFAMRPEVRLWSAFLVKDPAASILAAKAGSKRSVQNVPTTEVAVTLKGDLTGTIYVDDKLGVARGSSLKSQGKEYLVLASKITLNDKEIPASEFAFVAPEGATKREPQKEAAEPTWMAVSQIFNTSCMPCHNSTNRRANLDLTNYQGAMNGITPGNGAASAIVRSLRAGGRDRMPKNGPPLPEAQIKLIQTWIDQGAKG